MTVVAFNGSPRKNGNTSLLIDHILAEIAAAGIETEKVQLDGWKIHGCIACYKCFDNLDQRRAGAVHTFDAINHFFTIEQMIVPGSCYRNMGFGREKGAAAGDEEGLRIMKVLGENMAWLLGRIHGE